MMEEELENIIVCLETVEGVSKCMKVRVPGERIKSYANKIQGDKNDEGFEQQVSNISFNDAAERIGLIPVSKPEFQDMISINNGGYSYTALFETYPDIPVPDLSRFRATRLRAKVSEDDVERTLLKLCKQHSRWEEVKHPAIIGDRVTIDLYAMVGDIEVDEKNVDAVLGENDLLEGLDKGLPGVNVGDELMLNLRFPDVFYPELAGKQAVFSIKVKKVETLLIPEPDKQFIKDHGVSSGELDHFRQAIRTNMEKQLQDAVKMRTTIGVMADIVKQCPFEVPTTLVAREAARLISDPDKEGCGDDALDLNPKEFEGLARKRIARSLMAHKLAGTYDIKLDEKRLRLRVDEMVESHPEPEKKSVGITRTGNACAG